jgi:putative transposase
MAIWRRGRPDALLHHSDRGGQYSSEQFQRLMADHGVVCSMSRSGNVWDNAAMESFFSSLKTERTARKTYRTRDEARADVFDYIERFYNAKRRHSTIGYLSPMEFERRAGLAQAGVIQTGCRPRLVHGYLTISGVVAERQHSADPKAFPLGGVAHARTSYGKLQMPLCRNQLGIVIETPMHDRK